MKYFVFISVFFLFGCKPFSLEEDEFGEPRVTDDVIGENGILKSLILKTSD